MPELVLQTGHSQAVRALFISPDRRWAATGSFDNTIRIWSLEDGRELRSITGHAGAVTALACSPDGKTFASAGNDNDNTLRLWNVETGAQIKKIDVDDTVVAIAFSPDGDRIATGDVRGVITLRSASKDLPAVRLAGHTDAVFALSFSPNGQILVSGSDDNTVRIWNVTTGKQLRLLKGHSDKVRSIVFSPDGNLFVSGSDDKTIRVWDPLKGSLLANLPGHSARVAALGMPAADRIVSVDAQGETKEWMPSAKNRWAEKRASKVKPSDQQPVVYSRDCSILAIGNGDGTVDVIDQNTGNIIAILENYTVGYFGVAFSPDSHWLAAAGYDNTVKLWDLKTGDNRPSLLGHSGYVTAVAFASDNRIVSASVDHTIRIWDPLSRRCLKVLTGHSDQVSGLAVGRKRVIASASKDGTVGVWDLEGKDPPRFLKGHNGEVIAVAISPNEDRIVSGGIDGTIRLWETSSGRQLNILQSGTLEIDAVAFSPDGRFVASAASAGADRLLRSYNVATGDLVRGFPGHEGKINSVEFSPDGTLIATSGQDKSVRLWSVADAREIKKFDAHAGAVFAASFSPDGRFLASASDDGSIVLWSSGGDRMATLLSLRRTDDWLVVTPKGFFDGSPGSWQQLSWRFDNATFGVRPVELFFNEYYQPGVLSDIFSGRELPAVSAISTKDRRQPSLRLALTAGKAEQPLASRRASITVTVGPAPAGARDLRLFRNGTLVKVWGGDVLRGQPTATLKATFSLTAGENRLSAYAFNNDNIKSSDAVLIVRGDESLRRNGTLYILAVGVDKYSNSEFDLRYAVADAADFCGEMKREQAELGNFDRTEIITLLDSDARKDSILDALRSLAAKSQPEDGVMIYFAGHGDAENNRFYLIPHDLGYTGRRRDVKAAALESIFVHSISDEELELAVREIDARQLLLVIDACNSGQVLETEEKRRGPMNSKGLAQLAYEKGMYVLTATQNYQAAQEASKLGHGFLTFALVEEGLKTNAADQEPRDGDITLREWLDYAVLRVPQIQQDDLRARELVRDKPAGPQLDERSIQRPRTFYRREPELRSLVVARH